MQCLPRAFSGFRSSFAIDQVCKKFFLIFVLSLMTAEAVGQISISLPGPKGPIATGFRTVSVTTSALLEADTRTRYRFQLEAAGGTEPYQWSLIAGALPSGIQLQASGLLYGTTLQLGTFSFTVKVTDFAGNNSMRALRLAVYLNTPSTHDGPAELPRLFIKTNMVDTPAPGITTIIRSGGDFQAALDSASCGDTIELQAGATFSGSFKFPAKNCDDNHWIIVRTNAAESTLPIEGTRLTPCYAGVTSLPGRPPLHCVFLRNVLAKLMMMTGGSGPIVFDSGANHYRLIGLEVSRNTGTGIVYSLSSIAVGGTANNLIFDRMWVHGTAQDETNKGFELIGASYVSVVDSTFTDFHCTSISGSCTDAIAISAGTGNPVGPFKITGNFLEAAGENILFGGSQSATTPADIEIRRNHLFKPLTWLKGQSGFVGGYDGNAFVVKNLIEMKNAQRVLIEGNILDDSWGGFSQVGYGILITPKNQAGAGNTNLCPNCEVTDVTVRYDTISHVGGGLQIANALSDNAGAAKDGERYSIHDLVIDDIDPVKYAGPGHVAEILTGITSPLLRNVFLNHITAFPPTELFSVGDFGTEMANFIFSNSVVTTGRFPIWSTGGGSTNCAYYDKPLTTFDACFSPYSFVNNALIAAPSAYPPSLWPTGNDFPADIADVQFVNYSNGIGGDYHLKPTSPYKNAGTDGKDLGADIDTIALETAGVR